MQQDAEFVDSGAGPDTSMAVDSSTMDVTTVVEAGVDAPVEAGPQPVTVVVTNALGPEPNVTVLFADATGTPLLTPQTTSATGTVVETMVPAGSQATVVMGTQALPYLFTVQGVEPGDTIAVYDPTADAALSSEQVSVDSWPDGGPSGALTYGVGIGSCGNGADAPPVVVGLSAGCEAAGEFPVLITAYDANNDALGYTWKKGNVLPTDGGIAQVNVTNPWSTASDTQTINATGAPGYFPGNQSLVALTAFATGVPTTYDTYFGPLGPDGGMSYPFTYAAGYADSIQAEANLSTFGNNSSISAIATRASAPAASGTTSLDMSQLLPAIASSSLDTSSDAGVAQPVVTWALTAGDAGSIGSANGVVVSISWTDGSANGQWTLVAPPTASQVQPPALPSAVSAYAPSSSSNWGSPPVVAIVQASFIPGYAGLRAQAGTAGFTSLVIQSYTGGPIVPPLQTDGTLQLTAITANGD
jgi:hypothetical protein